MAAYFADLAANWRGWEGSRDYESIEGDLRIEATHDGHVNLHVALREPTVPEGWRVETVVRLEAGEALTAAATEVAGLVKGGCPDVQICKELPKSGSPCRGEMGLWIAATTMRLVRSTSGTTRMARTLPRRVHRGRTRLSLSARTYTVWALQSTVK